MKQRLTKVISKNIILILLFIGYYFLNTKLNIKLICPFYKLTNLYCPGCGITRCLFALIKLDFKKAINYNLLVTILLPFFIIYYLYLNYIYIYNKDNLVKKRLPKYFPYLLLIITIIFGILRNLEPLNFLAP